MSTYTFYNRQSSQHRQSSCSVHCTAALPVLAGLAVVEGVGTHGTNAKILLCHTDPVKGKLDKVETTYNDYCDLDTHHVHQFIEVIMK